MDKEIVICRDNFLNKSCLTEGKEYEVLGSYNGFYRILDDRGNYNGFLQERFTKKEKEMNFYFKHKDCNYETWICNRQCKLSWTIQHVQ